MTGIIPTLEQVDELHHKIAPSKAAYELIHTHCVIVAHIACQLAHHRNMLLEGRSEDSNTVTGGTVPERTIDEQLVLIGGLLHDIGTYRVLKSDGSHGTELAFDGPNYILHGLKGYEYLLDEGVDESIAQFARNHTGVGLTRQQVEAQGLALPPDDYVPQNLEQETVMVADKYHSKSTPPKFLTVEAYTAKAGRFGEENQQHWLALVEQWGVPDIAAMAACYNMRLKSA